MAIGNLFAYSQNFGKVNLYKCDYYGNALSQERLCLIDSFQVQVEQNTIANELSVGEYSQSKNFTLKNRDITISANFLFSLDASGLLNPSIDLLLNCSMWSYMGTTASYKITGTTTDGVSGTEHIVQIVYTQIRMVQALNTQYDLSNFTYYAVSETGSIPLTFANVDINNNILTFSSDSAPGINYWVEAFYYNDFALNYEPMFRIDSSEGSFYPCIVDKVDFSMSEDFVLLRCVIKSINYDRSTRYDFINSYSNKTIYSALYPLHRSRILLKNYENDINTTFSISDLSTLEYMDGLVTQSFTNMPFKEMSISIDNSLKAIYLNHYGDMKRTYVSGYYSSERTIKGNLTSYALRSSHPSFDRYPILSGSSGNSLSVIFGSQTIDIPYTVWKPGNIEYNNNNFVTVSFDWNAITKNRQGQPVFELL